MKLQLINSILILIICWDLNAQSIDTDIQLGKKGANQVIQEMGLIDHKPTVSYVQQVGAKLVSHIPNPPFSFHFQVVDMKEPNAFALPGGYIFVSKGILALMNSEDELATVIGHEIIHSYNRHSIKQMKRGVFPEILKLPGNLIGLLSSDVGNAINAPIRASSGFFMASYGRKQETEADRLGVSLSATAGYDPYALAAILQRISDGEELLTGNKEKKDYFSDHPYTPKRVESINKVASNNQPSARPPIAADQAEFFSRIDGLSFGPNPAQGLFSGQQFIHPDLDFGIKFPPKWDTFNSTTAVGATNAEQDGMIFLGVVDESVTPKEMAAAAKQAFFENYGIPPLKNEPIMINNFPAHMLAYLDDSGKKDMYILLLWVIKEGVTYQIIGTAQYDLEQDLLKTAQSFRSLSQEERDGVMSYYIKIVKAKEGETLQELSERTGNLVNPQLIAIANGIPLTTQLIEGQLVKVVKGRPYLNAN